MRRHWADVLELALQHVAQHADAAPELESPALRLVRNLRRLYFVFAWVVAGLLWLFSPAGGEHGQYVPSVPQPRFPVL